MKTLLEFVVKHLQFLYLNPSYRFTDSRTRGFAESDASLSLSGDVLKWCIANDRGQIGLACFPTEFESEENWFSLSLIRQYLEGGTDSEQGASHELANWLSANLTRVEHLFASESSASVVCAELIALRYSNSYKNWGWPKPELDE